MGFIRVAFADVPRDLAFFIIGVAAYKHDLTVLFREKFNSQGRIGKALAQSQYGAYIFHVFIVLLFQLLVAGFALPPLVKFVLVTLAAVPATSLFSYWVRKPLRL